MLPLAGPQLPASSQDLAQALKGGLSARGLSAREITANGAWPTLDLVRLDLTGARISRAQLPDKAGDERCSGFTASRFELVAAPAELESTPVHISLQADQAEFDFTPAQAGESWMLMQRAAHGEVMVEVARADIERLVQTLATEAAGQHGVEIKGVKVNFTSRGPRAVSITAEVTAKMFIASAALTLSGDVDLDDRLNAQVSNLRFHGDGMIANLAGGFIRPQLAKLEGRKIPLTGFALGEISLRDVQLETGETLRLRAQFGS
jgi:hypothetical protein